jgi:hypothetical protein
MLGYPSIGTTLQRANLRDEVNVRNVGLTAIPQHANELYASAQSLSPRDRCGLRSSADWNDARRAQAITERIRLLFRRCNLSSEVEIWFFVVQRNVLMPSDFSSLTRLRDRPLRSREYCKQVAQPFQWKFNRQGLNRLTGKLSDYEVGRCGVA